MKWLFRIVKDLINCPKLDNRPMFSSIKDNVKIMSFNIERDKPEKNDWENRRNKIVDLIDGTRPNIICMQEVMPHQYKFLKNQFLTFSSFFTDIFTGNSTGAIVSEGLAIFYSSDKYNLKEKGFIRLSDKFGFKNENWRICQWVKLSTKDNYLTVNYRDIYVFNTHLDHKSKKARQEGIKKILNKVEEIKNSPNYFPRQSIFFICGDFNAQITDEEMSKLCVWNSHYFQEGTMVNRKICIDYIFTQNLNCTYNIIRDQMSDHYPITLTIN